jgi:hypothetical protein
MLGELLCVILIPVVRTNQDVGFDVTILLVGIAVNISYLQFSKRQRVGILSRPGPVRFFFILFLCIPAVSFGWTACSDAYERGLHIFHDAIGLMETSEVARRDLGAPLKVGWPIEGSLEENRESGRRVLHIPVYGNHARGTLLVVATKANGMWKLEELTLLLSNGSVREDLKQVQ